MLHTYYEKMIITGLLAPLALCAQFEMAEARSSAGSGASSATSAVNTTIMMAAAAGSTLQEQEPPRNVCMERLGLTLNPAVSLGEQIPKNLYSTYNTCVQDRKESGRYAAYAIMGGMSLFIAGMGSLCLRIK